MYAVSIAPNSVHQHVVATRGEAGIPSENALIPPEYEDLKEVFSKTRSQAVPEHSPQDLMIDLVEGKEPQWGQVYNLLAKELETLRNYLDENHARCWIRSSIFSVGALVFFILKKDDSLRLCVDHRELNQISWTNCYPLPLISEAIGCLLGAKFYTKQDIRNAYHRVRVAEGEEYKTAFRTCYGHYEYTVMPFGLANTPAAFQSYINAMLRPYLNIFIIVYLDNIVVYSNTADEHGSMFALC
jgi:hypothetical protein